MPPSILIFDLVTAPESWTIAGPASPLRRVASPLADERFRGLAADLWEWSSRPVPLDRPDTIGTEAFVRGRARSVSQRLTDVLLPEADRRALVSALTADRLLRLVIRVRPAATGWDLTADAALALPWELLAPEEPGNYPVREGRLSVIRETLTEGAPELLEPSGPLTLAVTIAAPEGRTAFPYEQESFRMLVALAPLGQRVVFSNLGEVADLVDLVDDVRATAIHFRGHGLPGGLIFEDGLGFSAEVPVSELRRRLATVLLDPQRAGSFPGLVFLSAPFTAREAEEASSAAALHRSGFTQVIGFFGPMNEELNTRLEERFYGALAAGRSALAAAEEARSALSEPIEDGNGRVRYPFGWCQLAVYHRGRDRSLALPGEAGAVPSFRRRMIEVSGLPVLEHGFIGHRGLQHEVRRRVEIQGQRLIVIQGLGGLGKTALASQLLVRAFAQERTDQLVLRCRELGETDGDPILELRAQAEQHGRLHGLPFWDERVKDLRESIRNSAAGLAAVIRALLEKRPRLVVYVDNAETLQSGPDTDDPAALGDWLPGMAAWWAEMERLAEEDGCLVLATTRYAWAGLSSRAHLGMLSMGKADSLRLIDSFEALQDLPLEVRVRLAERVDGHPRTVEMLDRLIARQWEDLPEVSDPWRDLIVPILPEQEEKIRADLLIEKLWEKLSEAAREHARTLTVLRRPAPQFVIDRLGEARDELIRTGWLTRYREQVREDSGMRWHERWGLYPIISNFSALRTVEEDRLADHRKVGMAYEQWLAQDKGLRTDQWEVIFHTFEIREGDRIWPIVLSFVVWLRDQARFREAQIILEHGEAGGLKGERLARALVLLVQVRRRQGETGDELDTMLQKAQGLTQDPELQVEIAIERAESQSSRYRFRQAELTLRQVLAAERKSAGHAVALHSLAESLVDQGKYTEAEIFLRQALELKHAELGEEHQDSASITLALAGLLHRKGDFQEAERLAQRAVAIQKKVLGEKHPDFASALKVLAMVLETQGRLTEAESHLRRALSIYEEIFGQQHVAWQSCIHNLAGVLDRQGHFEDARQLLLDLLRNKRSGENVSRANNLYNLGRALTNLGLYHEALDAYRQALRVHVRQFGMRHPSVATTLYGLADVLHRQGRFKAAEKVLRHALDTDLTINGNQHRDHATILHALAYALLHQGRIQDAEPLAMQAVQIFQETVGEAHPDFAGSLALLARLLEERGDYSRAEKLLRWVIVIETEALDPLDPSLAASLAALASLLVIQDRHDEAELLIQKVLEIQAVSPGPDHPAYAASLSTLAGILDRQGRLGEAEALLRQALASQERAWGSDHPWIPPTLISLGAVLIDTGKAAEGENLLERAVEMAARHHGERSPQVARALSFLAQVQLSLGRPEARVTARRTIELLRETFGPEHPLTQEITPLMEHLAQE